MTQSDFGIIDTDETDGAELAAMLQQFRDAQNTTHSGSARPAYVQAGMLWLKKYSTVLSLCLFDGTKDVILITVDTGLGKVTGAADFFRNAGNLNAGTLNAGLLPLLTLAQVSDAESDDRGGISGRRLAEAIAAHGQDVATVYAGLSWDAVGSVGFFRNNSGSLIRVGVVVAGSDIRPAGLNGGGVDEGSEVPPGSWLCIGHARDQRVSVFKRVL